MPLRSSFRRGLALSPTCKGSIQVPTKKYQRTKEEVLFVDPFQDHHDRSLNDLVFHGADSQRPRLSFPFGNVPTQARVRPVRLAMEPIRQVSQVTLQVGFILLDRQFFAEALDVLRHALCFVFYVQSRLQPTILCCDAGWAMIGVALLRLNATDSHHRFAGDLDRVAVHRKGNS